MAARGVNGLIGKVIRSAEAERRAAESDAALLDRLHPTCDPAAFEALVRRHARTVLAACRTVSADDADVGDAFQATFLVLLRNAQSVRRSSPLDRWLYGVARKVARKAKDRATAERKRGARAAKAECVCAPDPSWRETCDLLHRELARLPDRYRRPLELCYFDGLTRDEVAAALGVSAGAVKGLLERGREALRRRLERHGVALSVGMLTLALMNSAPAVSPRLVESVVSAAGGAVSPTVAALAGGVAMTGTRQVLTALVAVAVGVAGLGWWASSSATAGPDDKPAQEMKKPPAKADAKGETKKAEVKERTITGTVVGPDGKPVQAELHLIWIDGKPEVLGKTKADGTFKVTVPLIEPGAYLVAKADGFGIDFMMPATNTPAEVTFKLPKDQPIRGRLLDTQGQPVAGATIQFRTVSVYPNDSLQAFLDGWKKRTHFRQQPVRERESLYNTSALPIGTTTDKDGRFELTGGGAERLVSLKISGAGRVETEVHVITRAGFDPKPFNDVTLSLRPPAGGEKLSWGYNPLFTAPDFTLAVEAEKPIRGRLTDAKTGKPRAGVEVTLDQDDGNMRHVLRATTDADGKYDIRGAKKWEAYTLRTNADAANGYLPCRVEAKDTVGYEPVVADVACPKGVVVTGTVRDKGTGKGIPGRIQIAVLTGNESVKDYPTLGKYAGFDFAYAKPDGTYRLVLIPGPMLLACGIAEYGQRNAYKPAKPDPKFPHLFHTEFGGLGYFGPDSSRGIVDGNWCKVIDAKPTDTVLVQDIDLEPATRTQVKVVDADGKPVKGVHATGISHQGWHYAEPVGDTDTITVLNVEPGKERLVVAHHRERKLVGAAAVKEADKNPVVTLGTGGTATGRVVDEAGKPLAGIIVKLYFDRREVAEVYGGLNENRFCVTDVDGKFEFDTLLPGYEFRLLFSRGKKDIGPEYQKAAKHTLGKHGEVKDLGDLKADAQAERED